MRSLIFYYDVVCPFAYLGSTQVERLAARTGVPLVWEPILLGGVFRALGTPDVPAATMPAAKVRHNLLDMKRWAAIFDVPLAVPPEHPRRTVEAMRLLHTVSGEQRVQLTHALYRAYWAEGRDLADRRVLADVSGLDVSQVDAQSVKDALRAATERALADGVFGVPGFVTVKDEQRRLYWGTDRIHLVERELTS